MMVQLRTMGTFTAVGKSLGLLVHANATVPLMVLQLLTVIPVKRVTAGMLLGVSLTVLPRLFLLTLGLLRRTGTFTALMEEVLVELPGPAPVLSVTRALVVQTVLPVQRATAELRLTASMIVKPLQYQQMTDQQKSLETSTA
jgi:hypothetical protein